MLVHVQAVQVAVVVVVTGVPHTRGDEPMGAGMNVQKSLCPHTLVTYNIVSGLVL